jgi:hypothetical protein
MFAVAACRMLHGVRSRAHAAAARLHAVCRVVSAVHCTSTDALLLQLRCCPPHRQSPPVTLVLDLDETLVHSSTERLESPDITFDVAFQVALFPPSSFPTHTHTHANTDDDADVRAHMHTPRTHARTCSTQWRGPAWHARTG